MFFNAAQFAPQQAQVAHPVGNGFDAVITNTQIAKTGVTQDNPEGTGKSFNVEFTTNAGKITNRYNLWNNNAKTVEISVGQLSALCHVTGVMQIDLGDQAAAAGIAGAALRNTRCKIDVVHQLDAEKKPTQYTQILRVLDTNGNEPGKAPAATQQQPQQNQNPNNNANNAWDNKPQQNPNPNPPANNWGSNNQPQQNQPVQQQPNTWQPGQNGGAPEKAPWSS